MKIKTELQIGYMGETPLVTLYAHNLETYPKWGLTSFEGWNGLLQRERITTTNPNGGNYADPISILRGKIITIGFSIVYSDDNEFNVWLTDEQIKALSLQDKKLELTLITTYGIEKKVSQKLLNCYFTDTPPAVRTGREAKYSFVLSSENTNLETAIIEDILYLAINASLDANVLATKNALIILLDANPFATQQEMDAKIVTTMGNSIIITKNGTTVTITGSNVGTVYVKTDSFIVDYTAEEDLIDSDVNATIVAINAYIANTNPTPVTADLQQFIVANGGNTVTVTVTNYVATVTGSHVGHTYVSTATKDFNPETPIIASINSDVTATKNAIDNHIAVTNPAPTEAELQPLRVITGANVISVTITGSTVNISGSNAGTTYVGTATSAIPAPVVDNGVFIAGMKRYTVAQTGTPRTYISNFIKLVDANGATFLETFVANDIRIRMEWWAETTPEIKNVWDITSGQLSSIHRGYEPNTGEFYAGSSQAHTVLELLEQNNSSTLSGNPVIIHRYYIDDRITSNVMFSTTSDTFEGPFSTLTPDA